MSIECKSVTWSESYLLGDSIIDREHKELFDLTEKLFHCENNFDEVMSALKELIKYTRFHFAHEEQFMKSINFKYLEQHKVLHRDIINKLSSYIEIKDSLEPKELAQELATFARDSIVHHILTEDKRVHHFKRDTSELKKIFNWKEQYKVDDALIDSEHQILFEIATKALVIPKENKKEHIRKVILELYDYMKEHFIHEEEYMRSIEYPDYENHKKLHNDIIEQMNKFMKSLSDLTITEFERKLIEYMDVWLINHIIAQDHKIVCFQKSL